MCELCVDGKEAEATVTRLTRDDVILSEEQQQVLNKAREDRETFRAHKATVVAQRNLFKKHVRRCTVSMPDVGPQKHELRPGEVMIIPDFKEKITLGSSLVEKQRNFYERSFRSLFALVVLFRKELGGRLYKHVFNFLSQDLSNDGQFVTQCFREVCTTCVCADGVRADVGKPGMGRIRRPRDRRDSYCLYLVRYGSPFSVL